MKRTANDPETDFYATVVYELRQPITTISGGVQLAKRLVKTDPSRAEEALEQVVTQIGRLNLMLGELRDRAQDQADAEALFKK